MLLEKIYSNCLFGTRFLSVSTRTLTVHRAKEEKAVLTGDNCADTILDKVWQFSVDFPGKIAFIDAANPTNKRTYREVYWHSYSLASFLRKQLNFKKNEMVCTFMPNSIDCASVYLGTTLAGGVVTPANSHYSALDLARQINDSGSRLVFCNEEGLETVLEAKELAPKLEQIITVGPSISEFTEQKSILFTEIKKTRPVLDKFDTNPADDLFCLPYSSGTTGLPKGVMLTHKNVSAMIANYCQFLKGNIDLLMKPPFIPHKEHAIMLLPFFHIFGMGLMLNGLYLGTQMVVMKKFDVAQLCKSIQDFKVRSLTVAPPVLGALAKHPVVSTFNLSSLQIVFSGAAPAGRELCNEVQKRLPSVKYVFQGYGMTELSMSASIGSIKTMTPNESVGLLLPGFELRIVDPETGKDADKNAKGEMWMRGDQIMKGYFNRPEETAETLDADGWLHTGDVGYVDDVGHIFIVDRLKELIKVKGFQVPPAELEDIIVAHPKVKDCAVVGVPCDIRGEIPKAFVVKKCETLHEEELQDFVNEKVSHYKQLKGGV
uniref:Uncharacterized protein n=1 Tax=Panagrolaimus sp. JU765 TaxID=591449 RepID=A0AC34QW20_9BILA